MSQILTQEDKKYLRKVCRYLGSLGMQTGTIEFDAEDGIFECDDIDWNDITHFSNNYSAEVPEGLIPIIRKIMYYLCEKDLIQGPDIENMSWGRVEIDVDCDKSEISVNFDYGYYDTGEEQTNSYEMGESEDLDEELNEIFDSINSELDDIPEDGELTLEYNGSGDSGYIQSDFTNGETTPRAVEDWCYRVLENIHGGWEINEGSQGKFYFNTKKRSVVLEHTYNLDETGRDTIFEEKF